MENNLKLRIEKNISSSPIVLFMKGSPVFPQCGFSAKACGILRQIGADFEHFDIFSDDEIRQGLKEYSQWPTYPQLYVQGQFVGGSDIMAEMLASGELAALIEPLSKA